MMNPGGKFISAGSRNGHAGSVCSPDYFMRSNVFCPPSPSSSAELRRDERLRRGRQQCEIETFASFHSVERLLKELKVTRVAGFLTAAFDPFLLESILCGSVILIKDAEDA